MKNRLIVLLVFALLLSGCGGMVGQLYTGPAKYSQSINPTYNPVTRTLTVEVHNEWRFPIVIDRNGLPETTILPGQSVLVQAIEGNFSLNVYAVNWRGQRRHKPVFMTVSRYTDKIVLTCIELDDLGKY